MCRPRCAGLGNRIDQISAYVRRFVTWLVKCWTNMNECQFVSLILSDQTPTWAISLLPVRRFVIVEEDCAQNRCDVNTVSRRNQISRMVQRLRWNRQMSRIDIRYSDCTTQVWQVRGLVILVWRTSGMMLVLLESAFELARTRALGTMIEVVYLCRMCLHIDSQRLDWNTPSSKTWCNRFDCKHKKGVVHPDR